MKRCIQSPSRPRDFETIARYLSGGICIAVGALVLIGWFFAITPLKYVAHGLLPMKANTAVGFILLGLAMSCHRKDGARYALVKCGASILLMTLAALTLVECAWNCELGIDEWLVRDDTPQLSNLIRPGRMSPVAAVSFLLLIVAIATSRASSGCVRWLGQLCILAPLLVSARALIGYLYHVPVLTELGQSAGMALHTTITFLIACIGLQMSRRDSFLAVLWQSSRAGSQMARRVLWGAIGLPVALGLVCVQSDKLGFVRGQVSVTIFAVLMGLLLILLLAAWSRRMNDLDGQRELAIDTARAFQQASRSDALTGLLNRRGFFEYAERELERTRQAGGKLSCLLLDIDFFKKINDAHGHSAGDVVLRQFAARLQGASRPENIIGRIGGEEFCVLLPGADETGAQILADRLRSAIAGRPVPLNDTEIALTTSGGVAELRPCHSSIHSLIDSADAALMVAKQTGRNKIIAASRLNDDAFPDDYGALLGGLQARDIMVPILAQVRLHDTVQSTARRLMDLKLDSLPVVDDEGKPVGFVTEQDLMNSLLSSAGAEQRIADCGPLAAAIFDESASAEEIASFFSRSGMQRVVIVCQALPIGVVSRRTLLRWLFNHGLKQRLSTSQRAETKRVQSSDLDRSITELQTRILRLVEIRETACGDELSSSVIGEATRIQESVESLLISCRDCECDWQPADFLAAGASSLI